MPRRDGISPSLRWKIFDRDGFACRYCGLKPAQGAVLQVDHVQCVAAGGDNDEENLVTSCWECNIGKGTDPADVPRTLKDIEWLEDQNYKNLELAARLRKERLAMSIKLRAYDANHVTLVIGELWCWVKILEDYGEDDFYEIIRVYAETEVPQIRTFAVHLRTLSLMKAQIALEDQMVLDRSCAT